MLHLNLTAKKLVEKLNLTWFLGKKYRKSKIEIWKNGGNYRTVIFKTVIQLWNVNVISVIIESGINSEFVLLWDVQKMGQQTSNSRIQQIAKSKSFFQQQMWFANVWESGNWCSCPLFLELLVLQMAQNWWWPNRSKDLLEEPVTCRESPWGRGLGSRPVQHPEELQNIWHTVF